jgi:hypothetical protein
MASDPAPILRGDDGETAKAIDADNYVRYFFSFAKNDAA